MKKALKQLLNGLDKLFHGDHDEVQDTDVRERMHDAIHHTLVEPQAGYQLPDGYGMFTPEGNAKVKAVLDKFVAHSDVAEAKKLPTSDERLAAFEDIDVESSEGSTYDDYFGSTK